MLRRTGDEQMDELASTDQGYRETAQILGLDKPVFYFTLLPAAYPDTLHRIINPIHRRLVINLCARYGRWALAEAYFNALQTYEQSVPDKPREILIESRRITAELYHTDQGPRSALRLSAWSAYIRPETRSIPKQSFWPPSRTWNPTPVFGTPTFPDFSGSGSTIIPPLAEQLPARRFWPVFPRRAAGKEQGLGRLAMDPYPQRLIPFACIRPVHPLGIYMAAHRDTWIDKGSQAGLFFFTRCLPFGSPPCCCCYLLIQTSGCNGSR